MPITAAAIEANGWVLRLTLSASPGNFASYTLDPDGSPRLVLATSHPGFVRSGGQAVAGSLARALVATKPLRRPIDITAPTVKVIDETDLGLGSLQVRLALSEHVYATDTGLTLTAAAGWRTGESAATIAVSNGSTVPAPLPIMRWALPSYEVTAGVFRLSLLVFSHHPQGMEPAAAVRFTATDGSATRSVWVTALATDTSLGDDLRCYTATIDPAGLNAGLLRCDAEVYPWLGAPRTTDPTGTRSMASLRTDGYSVNPEAPFVLGYDPAGTRYGAMWAFVDPVNGTATASAAMVQTTLALARAVAPASRPRDINTARQAGYLANRTLAAANGQAAQTRSLDGMVAVLGPGTHSGHGATAVTTGAAEAEIPFRIIGDPDDANPRANCVIQTTVAQPPSRATRLRYENLSLAVGTNSLVGGTTYVTLDRVTMAGRSGLEGATTAIGTASPPAGQCNFTAIRSRFWRYGVGITSGNPRCGLFRGNEFSATVQALAVLKCRWIGPGEDTSIGSAIRNATIGWGSATLAGQAEDVIVAWNDFRFARARIWVPASLPAATAGTPNPSIRRNVLFGNACERIGGDPSPFWSLGEDTSATMTYNIIEANSFVGDRANTLYSDPLPASVADTDSQRNQALVNRVAGNAFDWWPTKHDDFEDPTTKSLRTAGGVIPATGYRPQMVEAWSVLYGVGAQGNFDAGRTGGGNFAFEWPGRGSTQTTSGVPAYASDASLLGTGIGGGDYRPGATSPLTARVTSGNSDRDFAGQVRRLPGVAGAYVASPAATAPVAARSPQRGGDAAIGLALPLAPFGAAHSHAATATEFGWTTVLAAAPVVQANLAGAATVAWAADLAAASARHGLASPDPALALVFAIVPANSRDRLADTASFVGTDSAAILAAATGVLRFTDLPEPLLLPAGITAAVRTLAIGADRRRLAIALS
ncbi:hypothetical protein IP88_16380 [alpha proteobacterium AAP81b]|nr:hypothetical protein IP88_16380 [alpha proteobacterium AAP81b]